MSSESNSKKSNKYFILKSNTINTHKRTPSINSVNLIYQLVERFELFEKLAGIVD
jgi:hypothetical protein